MHDDTLNRLQHPHNFVVISQNDKRRTQLVLVLAVFNMVGEIGFGIIFGSMALLTDGWHMATHVCALTVTLFASRHSQLHAQNQRFAFGAGKIGVLGDFSSAVALGSVALMVLFASAGRLINPGVIYFDEALAVAVVGLAINVLCAVLLKNIIHADTPVVDHDTEDEDEFEPAHQQDPHFRATCLNILAETLTSVLAIIALLVGKYYGWSALDPIMGIMGALIITRWAYKLIKETHPVLLDESIALRYQAAIQETIEADADNRIADLHIWRVSPGHFAVILSIVSHTPKAPEYYKALLTQFNLHGSKNYLAHISVEVHPCSDEACLQGDKNLVDICLSLLQVANKP